MFNLKLIQETRRRKNVENTDLHYSHSSASDICYSPVDIRNYTTKKISVETRSILFSMSLGRECEFKFIWNNKRRSRIREDNRREKGARRIGTQRYLYVYRDIYRVAQKKETKSFFLFLSYRSSVRSHIYVSYTS